MIKGSQNLLIVGPGCGLGSSHNAIWGNLAIFFYIEAENRPTIFPDQMTTDFGNFIYMQQCNACWPIQHDVTVLVQISGLYYIISAIFLLFVYFTCQFCETLVLITKTTS